MTALRIGIGEVEAVVERESGHGQPVWLLEPRPANRLLQPGMRPNDWESSRLVMLLGIVSGYEHR